MSGEAIESVGERLLSDPEESLSLRYVRQVGFIGRCGT